MPVSSCCSLDQDCWSCLWQRNAYQLESLFIFLFNFLLLQQTNSTSSRKSQIINHLFYCFLKIALSQYHIKKKQGDGDCLSFFPIIQSWPNHCAPLLFDTDIDSAIYLHQCKHHNDHDDNALYHGPDMCCRDPISSMIPRHLQNPNQEKRASCLCSIIFPLTKTSVGKLLSSVLRFFHQCKQKLALFIREKNTKNTKNMILSYIWPFLS